MNLTPRQREIHALIAIGLCDKQIARNLKLGLRTVGAHKYELFKRLGVQNRVQAALRYHGVA